jgi:hypothetical protein
MIGADVIGVLGYDTDSPVRRLLFVPWSSITNIEIE